MTNPTQDRPPPPRDTVMWVPDWVDVEELAVECDEVHVVRQPRAVVLWPMVLHKHDQDCNRA